MKRFTKKMTLAFALRAAFGSLIGVEIVQGIATVRVAVLTENASQESVAQIEQLSEDVDWVARLADATSERVGVLSESLREATSAGGDEIALLKRYMLSSVETAEEVVAGLEVMLDEGDLDDDTAGMIEDLLFDVEDQADSLRKQALPFFQASIAKMEHATADTEATTLEVSGLREAIDGFAATSRQGKERAATARSGIEEAAELSWLSKWLQVVSMAFSLIPGIGLPLFLIPRINREVHRIVETLERVAGGDLTAKLKASLFDEFRRISDATNRAIDSMAHVVTTAVDNSARLDASSSRLVGTSESLSGGAGRLQQMTQSVASASAEMSSTMEAIASSVREVSQSSSDISRESQEMLQSLGEVTQRVEKAQQITQSATELVSSGSHRIGDLGAAAQEIGAVSEVIQDIAESTNLLALNATIEAARAGEAGKGFAVVATEVKDLARQTSAATEDIRNRIEGIQKAAEQAVEMIGQIDGVIQSVREESMGISEHVTAQSNSTGRITERISQAAAAAQSVATSVEESAEASREIARVVSEVETATSDTVDSSNDTRAAGDELSTISQNLRETLATFTTSA